MVLAALLHIRRVTQMSTVVPITDNHLRDGETHALPGKQIPGYVAVIRIHGPFLFGATGKLEGAIEHLDGAAPVFILKLSHKTALDGTGRHALEMFAERVLKAGRPLLCAGRESSWARSSAARGCRASLAGRTSSPTSTRRCSDPPTSALSDSPPPTRQDRRKPAKLKLRAWRGPLC